MENKNMILVVDDEERNRIILNDILISQGYEVAQAGDGIEAIKRVTEIEPDVVLLDLNMPNMGGLEVVRKLKGNDKTKIIPIVIVTGSNDMESRIEALKLGADDFLLKPPHLAELTARVRSLVKVKAYHDHMRSYQAQLEEEVSKRTKQLKKALKKIETSRQLLKEASLDTVFHLSRAAEFKDEDTASHLHRMSRYAGIIASRLGLNDQTVETLIFASPMHDVGKIGIPDNILVKPGALSPDEWVTMRKHTQFGGRILEKSSSDFIQMGKSIALSHHEKWDGSGYPDGLKGEKIPLPGRITALADVFDALSSKRPYKQPFSIEKSFKIIKEDKGRHFDPEVVEAFFLGEEEILKTKSEYESKDENAMSDRIWKSGE